MHWLIFLLLVVTLFFIGFMVVLSFGWKVINFVMSVIRHLLKMPDPKISENERIIDVEAEPANVPVTEELPDREMLAAQALSQSFTSAGRKPGNFDEEYQSLNNLLPQISNKNIKVDFTEILKDLKNIKTIFDKDPERYMYTKTLLAKCISGTDVILNYDTVNAGFIHGMKYAVKYIKDYIFELSALGSVANSIGNETLSCELTLMLDKMERFYWLKIAYPETNIKNENLIKSMVPSVTHKLQMCLNINNYELSNRDSADLLETSVITVKEMNVAIGNVLENVLSWDLIQADAALDTLRRELRIRGMY